MGDTISPISRDFLVFLQLPLPNSLFSFNLLLSLVPTTPRGPSPPLFFPGAVNFYFDFLLPFFFSIYSRFPLQMARNRGFWRFKENTSLTFPNTDCFFFFSLAYIENRRFLFFLTLKCPPVGPISHVSVRLCLALRAALSLPLLDFPISRCPSPPWSEIPVIAYLSLFSSLESACRYVLSGEPQTRPTFSLLGAERHPGGFPFCCEFPELSSL